ncbi:MAG: 4Fe-4S binding protein [Betaproteobacteria bacterium]|nr:MAG: 4Fe-4S binding protein [Betaproteobacteria bacterium]
MPFHSLTIVLGYALLATSIFQTRVYCASLCPCTAAKRYHFSAS